MAKCTLMPGIESISGSLKQKDGSRIIFKTFTKPSVNRKGKTETRMYISQKHERKTPLSAREIEVRQKFSQAAEYYRNLSNEQRLQYHEEWKRSNLFFKDKWYATLRGYIIARYFAEYKE